MIEHAAMATLQTLKEKLPGMKPGEGHRIRNLIIGAVYVFILLSILGAAMGPADVEDSNTSDGSDGDEGGAQTPATETNPGENNTTESAENGSEPAKAQDAEAVAQEPDDAAAPASEPVAEGEEQAQQATDSGPGPADMERVLANEGIVVEIHETANGDLHANYYSTAANEDELASDLGAIAGTYAAVVDSGHESDQLTIEVRTNAGEPVGEYVATASDAQAYMDGDITATEYAMRVLNSGTIYDDAQAQNN